MTIEDEQALATLLPLHCADELRNASRIIDPFERVKAIDRISDRLRRQYPWFFRGDDDDQDDRAQ